MSLSFSEMRKPIGVVGLGVDKWERESFILGILNDILIIMDMEMLNNAVGHTNVNSETSSGLDMQIWKYAL